MGVTCHSLFVCGQRITFRSQFLVSTLGHWVLGIELRLSSLFGKHFSSAESSCQYKDMFVETCFIQNKIHILWGYRYKLSKVKYHIPRICGTGSIFDLGGFREVSHIHTYIHTELYCQLNSSKKFIYVPYLP